MAHLKVKIINSLGSFEGKITLAAANSTIEDADKMLRDIIGGINTMQLLSIESDNGEATIFSEQVLKESIIIAKVMA